MAQKPKSSAKPKAATEKVAGTPSLPNAIRKSSASQAREQQLPHERDQTANAGTVSGPDPKMVQAQKDVERGIVDTDRRSAYGLSDGTPTPKANSRSPKQPK